MLRRPRVAIVLPKNSVNTTSVTHAFPRRNNRLLIGMGGLRNSTAEELCRTRIDIGRPLNSTGQSLKFMLSVWTAPASRTDVQFNDDVVYATDMGYPLNVSLGLR